ncbi:MAG: cysteine hydrolase [Clostridiales Family XIII bacterium]|jgi:nicotinamidase-related amidase|nr:cysteine hydrolase [Clostridiales Family XIII bacterium]
MEKYLIVVDMQNDFIDGPLGTAEARAIVPAVCEKIRAHAGPVIFTYDTHGEDYMQTQEGAKLPVVHCVRNTHGWALAAGLEALKNERGGLVFEKPAFSSRRLAEYLAEADRADGIESIELVGLCTDICVISNAMALKAFLPEVPIRVDAACCAGVTQERHETALAAMRACQIDIS